jgi:integrase
VASIRKTTHGTWEARVVRKGAKALSKSFKKKSDALNWARETEHSIVNEKKPKTSAPRVTLSEVIEEFRSAHVAESTKNIPLNIVEHDLGAYSIAKISRALLKNYLTLLSKTPVPPPKNKDPGKASKTKPRTYAASTVRHVFYAIKRLLEWHADKHEYPLPEIFGRAFSLPGSWEKPRDRVLVEDEESRLINAAAKASKRSFCWPLLIRFAIATGMRNQEMILARWSHLVDSGKGLSIPAENTKTRRGRVVPLASAARAILAQLRAASDDPGPESFVFFEFEGNPKLATDNFSAIVAAANLVNFKFHDLRHHALSKLASSGRINAMELMSMSGHAQMSTLHRYLKLFPSDLADKIDGAKLAFDDGGANVNPKGATDGS